MLRTFICPRCQIGSAQKPARVRPEACPADGDSLCPPCAYQAAGSRITADLAFQMGEHYADLGQPDKALAAFAEAVQLNSCHAPAHLGQAELFLAKRDYAQAIHQYTEAIRLGADDARIYLNRGKCYFEKNDLPRAEADFTLALRRHPAAPNPTSPHSNGTATASAPTTASTKSSPKEGATRRISLRGTGTSWLDNLLPQKPVRFVGVIALIAIIGWGTGFVLAEDKAALLKAKDWQVQPLFLIVHFLTLRLFVTAYTGNLRDGLARMNVSQEEITHWLQRIMGMRSCLVALFLAIPFCVMDYGYLFSDKNRDNLIGMDGQVGPADFVMYGIWCLEWFLNANIWVYLVGSLILTMWVLKYRWFTEPIEVVLNDRHYYPFLLMNSQGASIILGFGAVNAFYVWYAQGDLSDYLGLGITTGLLVLAFVPSWLQLKAKLVGAIASNVRGIQRQLIEVCLRRDNQEPGTTVNPEQAHQARVEETCLMVKIDLFGRLSQDLGSAESKKVLFKLLTITGSMGWKLVRRLVMD